MTNLVPEPQMPRAPEKPSAPKPPEVKPVEKPLGVPEQAIIQQIRQDSDPDGVLQTIAGVKPSEAIQVQEKPALSEAAIANSLRMTDAFAVQVLKGVSNAESFQNYIKTLTEQGVPGNLIEEVLLIRGINVTRKAKNGTDNNVSSVSQESTQGVSSDVEILRRAFNIEPLNVTLIRENPNLQRQNFDRSIVSLVPQGDQIVVRYGDRDWYKIDGKLRTGIVNGQPRKFVFKNSGAGAAHFEPFTDIYTIEPPALEKFQSDPESFAADILHETGHEHYLALPQAKQKELNDLFLQTPMLRDALFRFGAAIYGDKRIVSGSEEAGAHYLAVHSISNEGTRNVGVTTSDNEKGFKDTRSLVFDLNGQKQEVFAGPLISEFMSYMAPLTIRREIFDKFSARSRASRGGQDPRVDAIFLGFKRLQVDSQTKQAFDSYGIFRDNTPQLASDFAKVASTI